MKRFLALFLWSFLFTACEEEKPANHLIVGTSADYPPFTFYQNGEIVGFEIDLIRKIAQELQTECALKDLSFDSLMGALQTKRIDLCLASLTPTPERLKKIDVSLPYYRSYAVMLVFKDSPLKSYEDLTDKTVGVQSGSTYEMIVKSDWMPKIKGLKMRSLSKLPDLLQDFKAGRLDAIILGNVEAAHMAKTTPHFKSVPLKGTESVSVIAFPKGSPLVEPVNKLLQKWLDDGTLKKCEEKWLS